jgi:hypothetical protein
MSIEKLGEKYICDLCGREQHIVVEDNIPEDWSFVTLASNQDQVWSKEFHVCNVCEPPEGLVTKSTFAKLWNIFKRGG